MNSKPARLLRLPSLILAAVLQFLPLARVALPAAEATANILAIIFRWSAAAAAALGGVQAVSGASTQISNELDLDATNGQPFSVYLSTAPDPAHFWTATTLPAGLALIGTSGSISWRIQGTPTDTGTFDVFLTAKDQPNSGPNQTVTGTIHINVAPSGTPPAIRTQPSSLTVTQSQAATFAVSATGTAPLKYQWRFQGTGLAGKTNANLVLNPVAPLNAGNYDVIVSNGAGSVTSIVATLTVIPVVPVFATMVVQINGAGTVSPDYNQQSLQIGVSYTMIATPSAANAFSGWTGSLVANTPALTFVMQSNLVLQANFIPIPPAFIDAAYHGLFYEAAGVAYQSSGSFTAQTTRQGGYSGSLVVAGRKFSLSGRFDSAGLATNSIPRGRLNSLIIELKLNKAAPDQLRGSITAANNSWSADLLADRAVYDAKTNPAPQAGTYTLVVPGTPNATFSPMGDGFCAVTIDAAGRVKLRGTLADGTKLTQSSIVSAAGQWPFYVALYAGQGSILSWLSFANQPDDDINGSLSWSRSQSPSSRLFPIGFAVQTEAVGSKYAPPGEDVRVLNFSNGQVSLTGGNLSQNLVHQIVLDTDNKVTSLDGGKLTLSFTPASGLFKGSVINPATGKAIPFNGALLQKQNSGRGFFLGINQSGAVYFGP